MNLRLKSFQAALLANQLAHDGPTDSKPLGKFRVTSFLVPVRDNNPLS
jgi:hypothetical protein